MVMRYMKDRWGVSLDLNAEVCVRLSRAMGDGRVYIETGRRLRYVGEEGKMSLSPSLASYRCLKFPSYNAETLPACSTEFVVIAVRSNTALQAVFLSSSAGMFFWHGIKCFQIIQLITWHINVPY